MSLITPAIVTALFVDIGRDGYVEIRIVHTEKQSRTLGKKAGKIIYVIIVNYSCLFLLGKGERVTGNSTKRRKRFYSRKSVNFFMHNSDNLIL